MYIKVVGPCGSGKSTLAARLRALGYEAGSAAQDHSYVPDMWKRLNPPDVLIYLDVSLEEAQQRGRTGFGWDQEYLERQKARLEHAREHCDLYLMTDGLDEEQVEVIVASWLATSTGLHAAPPRRTQCASAGHAPPLAGPWSVTMIPSMEVRWFVEIEPPGAGIPQEVQDWFSGGGAGLPRGTALTQMDERDDAYLSLPDCADLGIKVRAGMHLEVKRRLIDAGIHDWGEGIAGRIERWVKWSFPLAEKERLDGAIHPADISAPPGQWVVVHKRRCLRKFEVSPEGAIGAVPAAAWPGEGCQLEVTRLECAGTAWWSLGFEAFGSPDRIAESLLLVTSHTMEYPGFPRLEGRQSRAYPAWLGIVLQSRAHGRP